MKKKVINVKYRKQSDTFPDWMKYEVTLLNENGDEEIIPAYGKDLQDALNRVVHDNKIEKLNKVANKIPDVIWLILFMLSVSGMVFYIDSIEHYLGKWISLTYLASISVLISLFLGIANWFTLKNVDK